MAEGPHLFPYRTQKLSPHRKGGGRFHAEGERHQQRKADDAAETGNGTHVEPDEYAQHHVADGRPRGDQHEAVNECVQLGFP